jgi:hypothetical protein
MTVNLLFDCDYIVLDTGYTSRIPKKFGNKTLTKINSVLEHGYDDWNYDENHVVCIKDDLWGKCDDDKFILYGDQQDFDFVKTVIDKDGVIILKNVTLKQAYVLIEYFGQPENRFCICCSINCIYNTELHEKDGKTVMYIEVDTESG